MKDSDWLFNTPIAHRGLHNDIFPENSLGAFDNAAKNGFPIELDVRLSDDDTVVVFHDDAISRMTGKDGYLVNILSASFGDYPLLNKDKSVSEYTIPSLKETLELINGRVPVLIEIKNTGACGILERKTLDILNSVKGNYAVQSFNPYSIAYFKENAPDYPRGILSCMFEKDDLKGKIKRYLLSRLKMNKVAQPDFISYKAEDLPNRFVSKTGLPVLAWTVRSKEAADKLDGVVNNIIFEKWLPTLPSKDQDKTN